MGESFSLSLTGSFFATRRRANDDDDVNGERPAAAAGGEQRTGKVHSGFRWMEAERASVRRVCVREGWETKSILSSDDEMRAC